MAEEEQPVEGQHTPDTIKAPEPQIGMKIMADDGYEWDVAGVDPTGAMITVTRPRSDAERIMQQNASDFMQTIDRATWDSTVSAHRVSMS